MPQGRKPPERRPNNSAMTPERARLIREGRIIPASASEAEVARQLLENLKMRAAEEPIRRKTVEPKRLSKGIRFYTKIPLTNMLVSLGKNSYLARLSLRVNPHSGTGLDGKPKFNGDPVPLDLLVEFTDKDLTDLQNQRVLHSQTVDGRYRVKVIGQGKFWLLQRLIAIKKGQSSEDSWTWFPAFVEPELK